MSSLKNEKGSVLVFITLMIVLLMIMVGLGLDTGQLAYSRCDGTGCGRRCCSVGCFRASDQGCKHG